MGLRLSTSKYTEYRCQNACVTLVQEDCKLIVILINVGQNELTKILRIEKKKILYHSFLQVVVMLCI
ncbi:MAG TPA: hypothetical protein DHV48_14485 [Prolixibacteraceae bacterium]|nr:hypothetical protein [Prolixibacteraceae bacterium]